MSQMTFCVSKDWFVAACCKLFRIGVAVDFERGGKYTVELASCFGNCHVTTSVPRRSFDPPS